MLDIEFSELSDTGRVRTHNEDYVGHVAPGSPAQTRSHGWIFALADGVGGQRQGEVASRAAVQEALAGFRRAKDGALHKDVAAELVRAANARVCESEALSGRSGTGMASTIVVCALRFDRATVAHIGDSRCYLIRSGDAQLITRDHTVAADQERLGLVTPEEAAESSARHVLSRSLGMNLFVNVDIDEVQLGCTARSPPPKWPRPRAATAISRPPPRNSSTAPMNRTAAITSVCSSFGCAASSAWGCTAAALISYAETEDEPCLALYPYAFFTKVLT